MSDWTIAVVCAVEASVLIYLAVRATNLPKLPAGTDWSKLGLWPGLINSVALCVVFLSIVTIILSFPTRSGFDQLPASARVYGLGLLDLSFLTLLWIRLRYDRRLRGLD